MVVYYILHEGSDEPSKELVLSAGLYASDLHDEILVFDQGFWQKNHNLWVEIQKADWKDVILTQDFKDQLHKDMWVT
jgi:transitional endoplasmic reticulum ATPase